MGCFHTTEVDRQQQIKEEIRKSMQKAEKNEKSVCKCLLLGSSLSGKSTIFKSIKHVNDDINPNELVDSCATIRENVISGILTLLKHSQKLYDEHGLTQCLVEMKSFDHQIVKDIQLIVDYREYDKFTDPGDLDYNEMEELCEAIDRIRRLDAIMQTSLFRMKKCYAFPDNMPYFFDKLHEIMDEKYIANVNDFLRTRMRTHGMIEYRYEIKTENKDESCTEIVLFDVGPQRNERRKWIHSFYDVSGMLFVTGLNDYCKSLWENETQNALLESLELFDEVGNSKWFRKSHKILLLNKTDLFRQCLKIAPLTVCFGDEYKGRNFNDDLRDSFELKCKILDLLMENDYVPNNDELNIPNGIIQIIARYFDYDEFWLNICYKQGIEFITQKFLALNRNPESTIHVHEICGIDHEEVGLVMQDVQQIITKEIAIKETTDNNNTES